MHQLSTEVGQQQPHLTTLAVEKDKHQVSLTRLEDLFTSQVIELLEEEMEEVTTMEAIMEEVRTELEPP